MDDSTSRFLDAFNAIEAYLRKRLGASKESSFHQMVDQTAKTDRAVQRLRGNLKDLGDLRNFVVHKFSRDEPMAVPGAATVERLQAIRDVLISPPKLIDQANRSVETCGPSDPVGSATKKMHDGSFSQLPVYDGGRLVALLTAETVARWLASRLAGGLGMLEEEPVAEILRHEEGTHAYEVVGRETTTEEGLAAFDDHLHSGRLLDAIILTHSGKATEKPLGIVTVTDVPKLLRALHA